MLSQLAISKAPFPLLRRAWPRAETGSAPGGGGRSPPAGAPCRGRRRRAEPRQTATCSSETQDHPGGAPQTDPARRCRRWVARPPIGHPPCAARKQEACGRGVRFSYCSDQLRLCERAHHLLTASLELKTLNIWPSLGRASRRSRSGRDTGCASCPRPLRIGPHGPPPAGVACRTRNRVLDRDRDQMGLSVVSTLDAPSGPGNTRRGHARATRRGSSRAGAAGARRLAGAVGSAGPRPANRAPGQGADARADAGSALQRHELFSCSRTLVLSSSRGSSVQTEMPAKQRELVGARRDVPFP